MDALKQDTNPTLVVGDLNARHVKWGYKKNNQRGKNVLRKSE